MASSADMQLLLSGDAGAFEALLQMLMSAENAQRSMAENVFGDLKKHPDVCVTSLVRSLRTSPDVQARSLCAVMLRKVGAARSCHWPCDCSEGSRQTINF